MFDVFRIHVLYTLALRIEKQKSGKYIRNLSKAAMEVDVLEPLPQRCLKIFEITNHVLVRVRVGSEGFEKVWEFEQMEYSR